MSQNLAIPVCDVVPHFFNQLHVFNLSLKFSEKKCTKTAFN